MNASAEIAPPRPAHVNVTRMACIVSAGGFAEWLLAFSLNTLVMPVFTTAFGLSAALVGWAITIPRLIDALSNPLIGHLSDRTRSRWGRRRPWIFGGGLTAAALFVLLWQVSPAWSGGEIFLAARRRHSPLDRLRLPLDRAERAVVRADRRL